ncbi:uncharacterized protein JCM15063_003757 [Sporobolomyces koalae]|uniref:uncharacterized protein n=1 Tax=Sporobolomyces koalae TaxID=500713 RepID=UPI0031828AA5
MRSTRRSNLKCRLAQAATVATTMGALMHRITPTRAALAEPAGNQVMLGFWFDSADPYHDSPSIINSKLGYNVPVFQMAQAIPLPKYNYTTGAGGPAPENQIERSSTDAHVFLTVYPVDGFQTVAESDFTALGQQILDYQINLKRTVFLRYAPEMQGRWMQYGQQPTAFLQSWTTMYNAVKAVAPETIMVWAPNTPQGYPYGQQQNFYSLSAADQALLDTDKNGQLDAGDDALSPYYPGDDLVDWIGLSLYYKGPYINGATADTTNQAQQNGYCALAINGTNPGDNAQITPWYYDYCETKPDKACMFAEAGAAYHVNDAGSASQASLQQAWLKDCVTNTSMLDQYPRVKLIMQFEYEKYESANDGTNDLRDYRLTNTTEVVDELVADLSSIGDRFTWAQSRAAPTSISSAGAPAATNSEGSTIQQAITATTRAKPTGFPSLFGTTSDGTQRAELIELGVMVAAGIFGAGWVMRTL